MKQTITHLSLKCKFKDPSTVEVTVINHRTSTTHQILWSYVNDLIATNVKEGGTNNGN